MILCLTYSLCLSFPLPDPANESYSLDVPYHTTPTYKFGWVTRKQPIDEDSITVDDEQSSTVAIMILSSFRVINKGAPIVTALCTVVNNNLEFKVKKEARIKEAEESTLMYNLA